MKTRDEPALMEAPIVDRRQRIFVMASCLGNAISFAKSKNYKGSQLRFIYDPNQFRGMRGTYMHVLPCAMHRKNFKELAQMAMECGVILITAKDGLDRRKRDS